MDAIVQAALNKWPNVPACKGWLLLDQRGQWRMRDEEAQAKGLLGEPIRHSGLVTFIERNYLSNELTNGLNSFYFQNGPQRVYVDLAYTPWIVRLNRCIDDNKTDFHQMNLSDQLHQPFINDACWIDEKGRVLFSSSLFPSRVALLHDHDLNLFTHYAQLNDDILASNSKLAALPTPSFYNHFGGETIGVFKQNETTLLSIKSILSKEVPALFKFVQKP